MRTGTNRFLSLLLTLCLLTGLLPVYSHAESVATPTDINSPMLLSESGTPTVTVTNTRGTLSYSVDGLPEGVTVASQQWCLNDTPIGGATNNTYDMSLYDMGYNNTMSVNLTLSNGQAIKASYSVQDNNTQWFIASSGTLIIGRDYNQNNTNFPISIKAGDYLDGIDILEGVNVTGASLSTGMVITVSGNVNNCSLTAHTVSIENGATISGGTINARNRLKNEGIISGTSIILGSGCTFANSGKITLDLYVNGTKQQVQYAEGKNLIALLDSLAPRDEGKGEVWMQNGTIIDDSATLDLSMQGASFVSVAVPMLTIKYGGAALSKTGRNDLTIGSSLSVSALNCEPISYEWYGLVSGNTYTHIGSGATFTIPTFISSSNDGSNIPAAQYYGNLYCEATLADGSTVKSPSYLIYLFPDQQPKDLVSSTEGKYTVGTVLSFDKNAGFFSETYGLTLNGYHWGSDESNTPDSSDETYTLTAADLQGGEHTITGWMYLKNQTTRQEHAYPATYTIPANNEWMLADGTLTFIGNYNASTTQFPIDGLTYSSVDTKAGSVIANAAFADCTVNNSGTIYGTTFKNCTVNNSGTIHVPVTIDGSSYTSTPDSDCQYLYGANTLATLNAWYAAQHPGESTEGLIWLDASTKQEVTSDATLGLNDSFILFGTMNVTIDAPTGYYAESTLYANVTLNANVDVSLDYTWKLENTERSKNRYYQLISEDVGKTLELTVTATTNDGYSVTRTAQTGTVQRPIYTVQVEYKDERLCIRRVMTGLDNLQINIPPNNYKEADCYFVPLTEQANPVNVSIRMSGKHPTTDEMLEQLTQLTLNRRQTDEIAASDFTLGIPDEGNPREVTITCTNPSKYWGIRVAGEDYPMYQSENGVFTVSVPVGEDVTVEARLPGSDAEKLLPSLWSVVGTIPASQWFSFSVTEDNIISDSSTLYWGETLTVDTNADTLTWCINGKVVAEMAGTRTYHIPADVDTLTITATKNGEKETRTVSPMCPFTMDTDYENETITFTLQDDCNGLEFLVSVQEKPNHTHNFTLGSASSVGIREVTLKLADPDYNYDFLSLAPANLQIEVIVSSEMEDHYLFTMLYPLERFNASMENADVSITANYPTSNDKWQTGISFSTKDPYTMITNVQLRNTADNKVLTYDYGDGEAYFTTKANTTYSVWVKQVSVEDIPGKGVQFTSFESDWLDTGLKVTTGITLDKPSPIAGQTVTATSGMVYPGAAETWKWERIENNSLVSVGTNANAYTISADDANRARNFNVSFRVTHTLTVDGETYSASATTGVLPIPQLVLTDQNGTTLTVPETGELLVPLGTTVTASMTNFEGNLQWLWTSNGDSYEESSSITISTSRPCALLKDPLNPNKHLVTVTCDIPAPQVTIDYVNEAFILENVPDDFAAMFSESEVFIALMDGGKKVGKISETTGSHAISDVIWENILGTQLPDDSEHTLTFRWFIGYDEFFGRATTLTIPARPGCDISPEQFIEEIFYYHPLSITPYSITYTGDILEIGIYVDDQVISGKALQNLEADTPYDLYYRQAASNAPTNPHFATDWMFGEKISTAPRMQLTPEFETITYAPGMSLDEDDLLTKLSFKNGGDSVPVPRAYLSLSLKEGSFPITNAGTYTVLLTTTADFDKAYELTSTECKLTIGALDLSNHRIFYSPEMTYTGSPLPLPSFSFKFYDAASSSSIRVDLDSSSDYEIMRIFDRNSGDGYSSMQNAGQYTIVLNCKGNYTGYPSAYVSVNRRDISEDCVVAPLSTQYDGSAKTLTVTVDGRTLTQDTDYTVLITRDNQTVTEIKEAGTYTVTLTGKDNYKGVYETTVTVSPALLTVAQTGDIAFTYSGATAFDLQDASALTLRGIVNGETVSLSDVSLTLDSKDAQTAPHQAAISATLTGADAGNYTLQPDQTCQVLVNRKDITVVPEFPATFAYTGATDVPMTGTGWTLEGIIAGDDVALDLTNLRATVADAAVGADKPVTITGWKLKGADAANYAVTTVTARTVTIIPAPAPAIEWPTPGTITYGDALSKSTLAADAHGTFAWQSDDTILSAGTHTQTIVYSPADTANYDYTGVTLTATATVTVAKAPAPAIVWPTASAITYGEALGASTLTSDDKNGTFAWKAADTALPAGTHEQAVVYTPADTANFDYTGVTLTATVPVTVNKAPAPAFAWPKTVPAITYGDALSAAALPTDAHGNFAWQSGDTILSAGTHTQTIVYSPADTANYDYTGVTLTAAATVTVNKAPAPAIVWPTPGTITYGDALSKSALTADAHGTFAWQSGDTILPVGTYTQTIVYSPADTANYDYTGVTLTATATVTVAKAPAPAIVWPTASAITYGEALGASTLTSDDKNGTFAWKAPSQILAAGEHFATVVCTPADKTNYDYRGVTLEKKIAMQVNKAATVIDVSGVKTDYTYTGKLQTVDSGAKLNHREAKLAYANNTFTTVREGNGLTVTITAPETANYLAAEATVTLTVTPSKAPAIQWPTAGKLTYGQQLSESELKGGSTNLGTFAWQEDATMKAIGPQTFTLTFTPADTENYLWDDSALVQGVKLRVDKRPVTIRADSKTKSYGAPDPALTATVEGLLDGDTIDYTLTRDPGETAGTYAIRVQASDTDTYTVTTVRGTLTISAKDMEALTPDTLPTQLYTGSALKPTPIVRDAAGNVLKEGRDYTLTYVDNQQPGLGTVIITGKGNYTGTLELTFPVVDPAESEALKALLGAETGEGSMPPTLVYTEDGTPKDYTLLDVTGRLPGQNEAVRVLLTEDTSGETEAHVLAIPADQLATLTRARGVRQLAFTHLNAAVLVPTEALLSGEAAKLAATSLGLTTEPETELTLEQLEALRYEIRIAPVEESDAVAVSVWLCWPEGEVELTPYLPGLLVGLTLTDDMTPENWTLAMRGADGTESAAETQLLVVPDDLLDVIDAIDWYSLTIHADGVEEVLSSPGLPPESSHRTLLGTVPSGTDCQLRLQPTDAE